MSNYDPKQHPIIYLEMQGSSVGMTQFEFDTFIVGKHHSVSRLIQDLLRRKQIALELIDTKSESLEKSEANQLVNRIDTELAKHDINRLADIEYEESVYWIDELARQVALEVCTNGHISIETQDKLMLVEIESFENIMSKAGQLTQRIKLIAEGAASVQTPLPPAMPRK